MHRMAREAETQKFMLTINRSQVFA